MTTHKNRSKPQNNSPFNQMFFFGIVEDNNDPEKLGRVKVRVFGIHEESKQQDDWRGIPTQDLPWATVIMPSTNGIAGVGRSPTGILNGTQVVVYFRDENFQVPMVFGTVPSVQTQVPWKSNSNKGFTDPNTNNPQTHKINEPDTNRLARGEKLNLTPGGQEKPIAVSIAGQTPAIAKAIKEAIFDVTNLAESAIGSITKLPIIPTPEFPFGNPAVDGVPLFKMAYDSAVDKSLVVGQQVTLKVQPAADWCSAEEAEAVSSLQALGTQTEEGVSEIALDIAHVDGNNLYVPGIATLSELGDQITDLLPPLPFPLNANHGVQSDLKSEGGNTFVTPSSPAAPVYPYNKVEESESGHIREVDDTPGAERIRESHRTGTMYEIHPNGEKVTRIVGNNYDIYLLGQNVVVGGDCNITIVGNANISARNANISVNDIINLRGKEINIQAEESLNLYSKNLTSTTVEDTKFYATKNILTESTESTTMFAKKNVSVQSTEAMSLFSNTDISVTSTADTSIIAGGNMLQQPGGTLTINAGGDTSITGAAVSVGGSSVTVAPSGVLELNGSAIALEEGSVSVPSATDAPEIVELPVIPPRIFPTPLPDGAAAQNALISQIGESRVVASTGSTHCLNDEDGSDTATTPSAGFPTNADQVIDIPSKYSSTPATVTLPAAIQQWYDAGGIDQTDTYQTIQLSPNFKLSDFTHNTLEPHPHIVPTSVDQLTIVKNLQALCVNILEPLLVQYPGFRFNSGWRPAAGSPSQHHKGEAVDIVFPGYTCGAALQIANWAYQNLPVDQIIFEHGNADIWIHMSHSASGSQRKMSMSFKEGHWQPKGYRSGFELCWPTDRLSTAQTPVNRCATGLPPTGPASPAVTPPSSEQGLTQYGKDNVLTPASSKFTPSQFGTGKQYVTIEQLRLIFPGSGSRSIKYIDGLNAALETFDIKTPIRIAGFLSQVGAESGELQYVQELSSGTTYEGRKDLGNTQPGDGPKYKGHGFIQVTGRQNHGKCGQFMNLDCINTPTILTEGQNPWVSAGWFWRFGSAFGDLNKYADADDIVGMTKGVNGGTSEGAPTNLQRRRIFYNTAKSVLGA